MESYFFLPDSKLHPIIKNMGAVDRILAYFTKCVAQDGKVNLLQIFFQKNHPRPPNIV